MNNNIQNESFINDIYDKSIDIIRLIINSQEIQTFIDLINKPSIIEPEYAKELVRIIEDLNVPKDNQSYHIELTIENCSITEKLITWIIMNHSNWLYTKQDYEKYMDQYHWYKTP